MATTFAVFDTRSVVLRLCRDLCLRITDFARLQIESPIPVWLLQRSLKGDRPLQNDEAQRLESLCRQLRALHADVHFPINYRDAQRVREILLTRQFSAGQAALGCDSLNVDAA